MKAALAVSHGRMAACFAGVDLRIVGDNAPTQAGGQADLDGAEVLSTHGWHPLAWGRELVRRDVGLLLCAAIDQSTWASVRGHGIQVIPNAMGEAGSVLADWRSGHLSPPRVWPAYASGFGFGRGRGFGRGLGLGFRGGRGRGYWGASYAAPAYPYGAAIPPYGAPSGAVSTPQQETDLLKGQAKTFEDALEGIKKRIAEIAAKSEEKE